MTFSVAMLNLVVCLFVNMSFLDAAMHQAVPAIAAAGVSPIVRIADNQGWMVKRKLDLVPSFVATDKNRRA